MAIIELHQLTKRFGSLTAVDHIDLEVPENEIFGFLGPNGAGKTTTINMINTLSTPTEGYCLVMGHDPVREPAAVRQLIALVSQETALYDQLTAEENLRFQADLYGVPRNEVKQRMDELLELMLLSERRHDRVGVYSGGMKRRLVLARALLSDPQLLILDEPTVGLDPQGMQAIWDRILELKKQGRSILLATNLMFEADALCDHLVVIDDGRIIAQGRPQELKAQLEGAVIELSLDHMTNELLHELCELKAVSQVERGEGDFTVRILAESGEKALVESISFLDRQGIEVKKVEMRTPTLNDVFFKLTGRGLRE